MQQHGVRTVKRRAAALAALVVVGGMLLGGQIVAAPAHAVDLPTWDDVQAAKQNEATAAAKVKEIEQLIAKGKTELQKLQEQSADANSSWQSTQQKAQQAAEKAETLKKQADDSKAKAEEAADQAGVIVAQMYRSGGVDRNMELFLQAESGTADALLERLASMEKATERNTTISEEAEQAMNTASTLGEQAKNAQKEREKLSAAAETKAKTAAQAADTQRVKVEQQQAQITEMEAQLAALKDTTTKTVSGYEERLRKEEEERKAAAAAEAERLRKQAEEEAKNNANNGGGGGGGVNPGGGGGGSAPTPPQGGGGWWRPTGGYVSTYFYQVPGHTGIDLATGCGTPIIAPRGGTISFAGWMDPIGGNMVYMDHGDGFQTRYAHLSTFGPGNGAWVPQGGVVGYVGTTGMSTGCHLHYEVLLNGVFQNPIPSYGVTG